MSSEEPGKPGSRRWRGIAVGVGVALILIVSALSSTLLFREDLAELVLRDRIAELGLKDPRFRVEHFTHRSISIAGFSAGTAVSFDRLTVGFSAQDILKGHVERIELTGLRLDMTQPGPWAGIGRKSDAGARSPLDLSILPVIKLRQARLRLAGPAGLMTISAAATLQPDPAGDLALQVKASTMGPPGDMEMGYDGTIRLNKDGSATATGRLLASSPSLALGQFTAKSLKIELPLSATLTAEGEAVIFTEGARFSTDLLDLAAKASSGPMSGTLKGRLITTISSGGWFDSSTDVTFDAHKFRNGNLVVDRFSTALALRIKAEPGNVALDIARDGRLAVNGVRAAKNSSGTNLSSLLSGKVALSWPVEKSGSRLSIDHRLAFVPAPFSLPGAPNIQVIPSQIETAGRLDAAGIYQGRIAMTESRITRGSQSVTIAGMSTGLSTKANLSQPSARITIKNVRDVSAATIAGAPIAGVYDMTATVRQSGSDLFYQADIGGLGIEKLINIIGAHDLDTRTGNASVSVPGVALGSDGIPPVSVIPASSIIRKATGNIAGEARFDWSNQGFNGRATLRLDGIGGETDGGTIEGLSGAIVLDRLMPPSTAPEQTLRIGKIEAGATLMDTSIRFALLPSGILRIGRAETNLANGKIIVVAPAIDFVAQKAKATVTLQGVQLAQLLSLIDLGDLEASGQLHGLIPIRIDDGKLAIDSGALASLGGGTLRFKSERAKQVLRAGGDQVALMLQALENFSYERLGIGIDKSLAGDARLTLRTLGHNPAVLKGRKFQINVNLDTNLDRLLNAALEWYQLSGKAMRSIFAPGKRRGSR